ncbi:hypothetical protein BGX12_12068 [Fibrobacter sp. UWR4]|nr:hypothetical protein BGX12_12068 [Fibrobacter sp. UWR4]PZW63730.1 hypothetical protein C8E88_104110 [Fibrobacter sp. UWR1]
MDKTKMKVYLDTSVIGLWKKKYLNLFTGIF